MTPQRIQRQRTKGWRMPDGAIYVGHPTRWGNPFRITRDGHLQGTPLYRVVAPDGVRVATFLGGDQPLITAHQLAVDLFRQHVGPGGLFEYGPDTLAELRRTLAGHDLACWCSPALPCHADVLLELANGATS